MDFKEENMQKVFKNQGLFLDAVDKIFPKVSYPSLKYKREMIEAAIT